MTVVQVEGVWINKEDSQAGTTREGLRKTAYPGAQVMSASTCAMG